LIYRFAFGSYERETINHGDRFLIKNESPEITSLLLRVHKARMTVKLMSLDRVCAEPSMNKKLQQPGWAEWKLAGLPLVALKVYCRLWTTTAVMLGRQFWHSGGT